jgi:hypothetical protein
MGKLHSLMTVAVLSGWVEARLPGFRCGTIEFSAIAERLEKAAQ